MNEEKSICQKIADWFAPQTKPQTRFVVPRTQEEEEAAFDWSPVLAKAKINIQNTAAADLLVSKANFEREKEAFSIDITSFKGNSIKIVYKGQIDIIPIADIRRVTLNKGKAPRIEEAFFVIRKDGSFYEYPRHHNFCAFSDENMIRDLRASVCYNAKDDEISIAPVFKFSVPFGLGESIVEKIQELLAQ